MEKYLYDINYQLTPCQPSFQTNFKAYREILPSNSDISNYILFYYEMNSPNTELNGLPVLPDGCMDLIFVLNNSKCHSYILGTTTSIVGAQSKPNNKIIGVRFAPGGFFPFFRTNASHITSYQIPLSELYNNSSSIEQQIFEAHIFNEQIKILEEFLNFLFHSNITSLKLIEYCVNKIISTRGKISIKNLSDETFFSTRYINRLFHRHVGLSPKSLCEIMRFQLSLHMIIENKNFTMADISVSSGYYDQCHMNREYQNLINCTASYLKEDMFFLPNSKPLKNIYFFNTPTI